MKSRKNTSKRGGAYDHNEGLLYSSQQPAWNATNDTNAKVMKIYKNNDIDLNRFLNFDTKKRNIWFSNGQIGDTISLSKTYGGSKHKSRKAKKTKKRRGSHEGGKKKCPKHCRRHTRRTRKGLKHRKN